MAYVTKQNSAVIEYISANPEMHFTADELAEALSASVSRSTVYRRLEKLCAEGVVRKYETGAGNKCCYQYVGDKDCETHYHLVCTECNKTIHLKCDTLSEISAHIKQEHDFVLDNSRTVLYGKCGDCLRKPSS